MRRTLGMLVGALALLVSLSACETMKGVGRDLGNAGQALQNMGD